MKRYWSTQELREHCSLSVEERSLLAKKTPRSQLGFAVLLKFFQLESRFPRDCREVPRTAVEDLAQQLDVSPAQFDACDWHGSVGRCSRRVPTQPMGRTMPWPGTVRGGLRPHPLTTSRLLVEQTPVT